MPQLNIHLRPDFEKDLARLMKLREIPTKSEAIRVAVRESVERSARASRGRVDFRKWTGRALETEPNPNPRFTSDDDLWT